MNSTKNEAHLTHEDYYRIRSYEVDLHSEARISSLCDYFQESAWRHAEALGIGFAALANRSLVWVLSRFTLRIYTLPRWGEKIMLRTWPKGTDRLFALRDVEYLSEEGAILAAGTSGWLILDYATKRPQRLDEFKREVPFLERSAIEGELRKIAPPEEGNSLLFRREASYSDIDMNQHVNNAAYIRYIQDALPRDFHLEWTPRELSVNFLSETFYSDSLEIRMDKKDIFLNAGVFKNNKPACTALLCYQKR